MCHPESSAQALHAGFHFNQTLQQLIPVISSPSLPVVFEWNKNTQISVAHKSHTLVSSTLQECHVILNGALAKVPL